MTVSVADPYDAPAIRWDSSRAVTAVLDEVRRQIGVVYPGE